MLALLLLACSNAPDGADAPTVGRPQANQPDPAGPNQPGPHQPGPGGPHGPPGPGAPPVGTSGNFVQDPTGFPAFHDIPPQPGPAPAGLGAFTEAQLLAARPDGGFRPQIAVGPDGTLHLVYYDRTAAGDIIRYRTSRDGESWTAPEVVSHPDGRNWGPDLVVRPDGSVVLVYDHTNPDFTSRGWLRERTAAGWSAPVPLTPDGKNETGSGHVAAVGDHLAYVWIGKPADPNVRFRATWRWRDGGTWSEPATFTDGTADAWHTNVEAAPDGSVIAGYDVGTGGSETRLFLVHGKDGRFDAPEDVTATSHPGERPNFAFRGDTTWVTWFRKVGAVPLHVYVRAGRPGAWGPTEEPSKGLGGYHFDPDIAVNDAGVRCLVWGWDGGQDAELLYALDRGRGWEAPRRVAEIDWGKPGLPSVEAGPDGTFHLTWTQGVRGSNEVFYARLDPRLP